MKDQNSGRSKGFAIIEMNDEAGVDNALQMFDEETFGDRPIRVILAWHRKGYISSSHSRGESRGYRRPGGDYGPERLGGGYGPSRPRRSRPGRCGKDRNLTIKVNVSTSRMGEWRLQSESGEN